MATLPPPRSDQIYVTVSALDGGWITLPDHCFVHPAEPDARRTVPSLSFLITHAGPGNGNVFCSKKESKPFRMLFDLGLRKSEDRYAEVMQKHLANRRPFKLGPGIKEQLEEHGLKASDIDVVALSHVCPLLPTAKCPRKIY